MAAASVDDSDPRRTEEVLFDEKEKDREEVRSVGNSGVKEAARLLHAIDYRSVGAVILEGMACS